MKYQLVFFFPFHFLFPSPRLLLTHQRGSSPSQWGQQEDNRNGRIVSALCVLMPETTESGPGWPCREHITEEVPLREHLSGGEEKEGTCTPRLAQSPHPGRKHHRQPGKAGAARSGDCSLRGALVCPPRQDTQPVQPQRPQTQKQGTSQRERTVWTWD